MKYETLIRYISVWLALTFSLSTQAQSWKYMGQWRPPDSTYYVDVDHVNADGHTKTVWIKVVETKSEAFPAGPGRPITNARTMPASGYNLIEEAFDLSAQKWKYLRCISYNVNGCVMMCQNLDTETWSSIAEHSPERNTAELLQGRQ